MKYDLEFKRKAAIYAAIDPPSLPEGTQVVRREGWYQIINPSLKETSGNEVMLSLVRENEVERVAEETFSEYRKFGLPFKWAIGPMSSPVALERAIERRASASWGFQGMTIDTNAEIPRTAGIVVEIVTPSNFDEFLEVNLSGWGLHQIRTQTESKLKKMLEHPHCRLFLARQGTKAVGSAGTVLKADYGYLVGAVVLDQYRGCGAYRELIQGRLTDLHEMGIEFAVTQARDATSAPILSKLGFKQVFKAKIYQFETA